MPTSKSLQYFALTAILFTLLSIPLIDRPLATLIHNKGWEDTLLFTQVAILVSFCPWLMPGRQGDGR
jgi:hypothetical protein